MHYVAEALKSLEPGLPAFAGALWGTVVVYLIERFRPCSKSR